MFCGPCTTSWVILFVLGACHFLSNKVFLVKESIHHFFSLSCLFSNCIWEHLTPVVNVFLSPLPLPTRLSFGFRGDPIILI